MGCCGLWRGSWSTVAGWPPRTWTRIPRAPSTPTRTDFDGHHGFDRERLTAQLARAGSANVSFVDATTILKGDREYGVFLCTATKGA